MGKSIEPRKWTLVKAYTTAAITNGSLDYEDVAGNISVKIERLCRVADLVIKILYDQAPEIGRPPALQASSNGMRDSIY